VPTFVRAHEDRVINLDQVEDITFDDHGALIDECKGTYAARLTFTFVSGTCFHVTGEDAADLWSRLTVYDVGLQNIERRLAGCNREVDLLRAALLRLTDAADRIRPVLMPDLADAADAWNSTTIPGPGRDG
jgi:hypothetical protein